MIRRGFTLIELLVVIAIIAILAAILFPVFAQAKLAAKKSAGLSQMKQIGTAVQMYSTDYDDGIPTWNECLAYRQTFGPYPQECLATIWLAQFHWDAKLSPYVKNGRPESGDYEGIWKSPGKEPYVGRSIGMQQLAFWEPSAFTTAGAPCNWNASTNPFSGCYFWLNLAKVQFPAEITFSGDAGTAGRIEPFYFLNGYAERFVPTYAGFGAHDWGQEWRYGLHGANYSYMDGHAKYEPGDKIHPNPNRAPTLAFPLPVTIALYCSVIKYQATTPEMRNMLYNRVLNVYGGTCPGVTP
jgi:prepilin-type N-terminal cleavage/methylation domain-containing protein/prepilin-type processing-associated H-X9-DG protein